MPDERPKLPNNAKLTIAEREEMVRRFAAGESLRQLAEAYSVSVAAVRKHVNRRMTSLRVLCDNQVLSYQENVRWALKAAGEFIRTGQRPKRCPNDSAWFLYVRAVEDPKEFMAKVAQLELRADDDAAQRETKRHAEASIEEIDAILANLEVSADG
ncbi:MAG: hypothetical protein ACOY3P_10755 [Planctomycetota bacterium]